jgi:hypothetical protein
MRTHVSAGTRWMSRVSSIVSAAKRKCRFSTLLFATTLPFLAPPVDAQTVAAGFTVEPFSDIGAFVSPGGGPIGIAVGPAGGSFGLDVYVSVYHSGIEDDVILRLTPAGTPSAFATLAPESDPFSIEFPEVGSAFDGFLYVSANNRDFGTATDCGGIIQRVDPLGVVTDWTLGLSSIVDCQSRPGNQQAFTEPASMAFATTIAVGDGFPAELYVANFADPPFDVGRVNASSSVVAFASDGLHGPPYSGAGILATDLAFGTGGGFGTDLYLADEDAGCDCIRTVDSAGVLSAPFATLASRPLAIEFAPPGAFGGLLYVALANGEIHAVGTNGSSQVFASGFAFAAVSWDAIGFAPDGGALFVTDFDNDRVFRIAPIVVVVPTVLGPGVIVLVLLVSGLGARMLLVAARHRREVIP